MGNICRAVVKTTASAHGPDHPSPLLHLAMPPVFRPHACRPQTTARKTR